MPFANRRSVLYLLGGGALLVAAARHGQAAERRLGRLIEEARSRGSISARIDFISGAFRGTRYLGYTLIGGPRRPEQFVVRDDGFDCVTFCETVLAAAIAEGRDKFDSVLKMIRYHDGVVGWRERNHYFFEWGQHNIENKVCRPVDMAGSVEIEKEVNWHRALGRRRFAIRVIPSPVFLKNKPMLAGGDIVGFITRRPNLDYFHVGFVIFGRTGELLLRHASQSRGRVLDERMDQFIAANRVRYVTLLRPQEPHAVARSARDYAAAAFGFTSAL
ncbi:MAG TPA: N-acetylmuramoyl-L-alanine amidase-like domain-containing protein [Pseudolabrys sp.]|nr:N-acetylmuramoyl-L-alanine amidase-like domain-containing protein [Pseudolabrys sp.]